jgi:hypothetical protein
MSLSIWVVKGLLTIGDPLWYMNQNRSMIGSFHPIHYLLSIIQLAPSPRHLLWCLCQPIPFHWYQCSAPLIEVPVLCLPHWLLGGSRRACILLGFDQDDTAWSDGQISSSVWCGYQLFRRAWWWCQWWCFWWWCSHED